MRGARPGATLLVAALLALAGTLPAAQDIAPEYTVKAAYLFRFLSYVEWPEHESANPLLVCLAGRNPFGPVWDQTFGGETVQGRELRPVIILSPEPGCHVIFVPAGSATTAYLRSVRGTPVLTVGEAANFLGLGGMIRFFVEDDQIRFEINPDEVNRAGLRISARLLQLARIVGDPGAGE